MRRVMRRAAVMAVTGLSASSLWRREQAGEFPARVALGGRACGWFEDEVLAWLEGQRRGPGRAPPAAPG